MDFPQAKIEIFTPYEAVDAIREAVHQAGCGVIGDYDHCCSITEVRGFWRPLSGANPYDGEVGKISEGHECKIEVNCKAENVQQAVNAIRAAHPYEEPLINILPLLNHLYN
jgi:hypothetical protein